MSTGPARPRRPLNRLVVRIYLACLLLVLVVIVALDVARRQLIEPSQHRGTLQLARLVASMAEEDWGHSGALGSLGQRLRNVLDANLWVFQADGSVVSQNTEQPPPRLTEQQRQGLLSTTEVVLFPPRTAAATIRLNGDTVGYVLLAPRSPQRDLQSELMMLAIVAGVVLVVSVLLARSIARPLTHLTRVSRAFGEGDLSARAKLDRGDEFGELGRAFDDMADRTAHLVRAQKELIANISHELRTPLSRLRVALDLAIERGDERRMQLLTQNVQGDLTELEQMLQDVLSLARLDLAADRATGTPLPFKKTQVGAQEVLDAARDRFEKGHPDRRLEVAFDADLPSIEADPVLLRRAIDNLLENAARYSDRGLPITLRASSGGGSLIIDVEDRGVGITPEDLPHIFEPFFRGDRSRTRGKGGVGLGLVLARRIVEAHGGTLSVTSTVDRGTTMRLLLPVCRAGTVAST